MYNVGDRVLYPLHGAGVIEAIEERKVLGESAKYYAIEMPVGGIKIMIPVKNADATGLRYVVPKKTAELVIEKLKEPVSENETSWNRRYRENFERVKSGDVFEVAKVVKVLSLREVKKGLSTGEKKMLYESKQILLSELVLSLDEPKETVEEKINEKIFG